MVGLGNERFLSSASHGAGRALTRYQMRGRRESELGLDGVECITLKKERLVQEAPAAYKPIQPVVDIQAPGRHRGAGSSAAAAAHVQSVTDERRQRRCG
jgi:tRNA-splicing ligase RtcB